MIRSAPPGTAVPNWRLASVVALAGHTALFVALAVPAAKVEPRLPDPVMIVELPQGTAPAASPAAEAQPENVSEMQEPLPQMVQPRLDIPEAQAPVSSEPVVAPVVRPIRPVTRAPAAQRTLDIPAPPRPLAAATGTSTAGEGPADDAGATQESRDWYALIAAHLERNKRYPREARRDGLQGTPTVRFTVDRRGRVSNVSIRDSSGHPALDEATVDLMRRVSPLPAMPRSMGRDAVTISLPIEYTLRRN